jgi:hypothetical protein
MTFVVLSYMCRHCGLNGTSADEHIPHALFESQRQDVQPFGHPELMQTLETEAGTSKSIIGESLESNVHDQTISELVILMHSQFVPFKILSRR